MNFRRHNSTENLPPFLFPPSSEESPTRAVQTGAVLSHPRRIEVKGNVNFRIYATRRRRDYRNRRIGQRLGRPDSSLSGSNLPSSFLPVELRAGKRPANRRTLSGSREYTLYSAIPEAPGPQSSSDEIK